jgi:hypothetical protein
MPSCTAHVRFWGQSGHSRLSAACLRYELTRWTKVRSLGVTLRPTLIGGATMKRRKFLGLVAGGIAWPAVGRAQQQTMPLIGFLSSRSPEDSKPHLAGFLRGLGALGYIDGKTATI